MPTAPSPEAPQSAQISNSSAPSPLLQTLQHGLPRSTSAESMELDFTPQTKRVTNDPGERAQPDLFDSVSPLGANDDPYMDSQRRSRSTTPGSPTGWSSRRPNSSIPNAPANLSTPLNRNLDSPHRHISSAPRRRGSFANGSINSSPAQPHSQPRRAVSDPPSSPTRPQIGHSEAPADFDFHLDEFPARRSLRTRTAIQLQPYTREALLYKATLVRAGAKEALVKGSKAPQDESHRPSAAIEEDSQDKEWAESQTPLDDEESGPRRRRSLSPKGKGKDSTQRPAWARSRLFNDNSPPRRPGPMRRRLSPEPEVPLPESPPRRLGPMRTLTQKGKSVIRPGGNSASSSRSNFMDGLVGTRKIRGAEHSSGGSLSSDSGREKRPHKAIFTYSSKGVERSRHRTPPRTAASSSTPPHGDVLPNSTGLSSSSPTTAAPGIRSSLSLRPQSPASNASSSSPLPFPDFESRPRPYKTRPSSSAQTPNEPKDEPLMIQDEGSEEEASIPPPRLTGRMRVPESFSDGETEAQSGVRSPNEGHSSVQSISIRSEGSGSPTTTESEDDAEALTEHQAKLDRQRRKALVRVLPAFMIKKLEAQAARRERNGSDPSDEDSDDDQEEHQRRRAAEALPEQDQRRGTVRRIYNPGGRLDIQGDSQSSDSDAARRSSRPEIRRPSTQDDDRMSMDRVIDLRYDVGDLIASSEAEESEDDDVDIGSWLQRPSESLDSNPRVTTQTSRRPKEQRPSPSPRDGDLIDRMLSRHVGISAGRRKASLSHRSRHSSGTKSRRRAPKGQAALDQYADGGISRQGGSSARHSGNHPSRRRQHTAGKASTRDKIVLDLTGGGPDLQQRKLVRTHSSHRHDTRDGAVSITWREEPGGSRGTAKAENAIIISDDDDEADGPPLSPPMNDLLAVLQPNGPEAGTPQAISIHSAHPRQAVQQPRGGDSSHSRSKRRDRTLNVTSYSIALSRKSGRDSLIDFGFSCPPIGSAFGASTYLGSGRLTRLLSLLNSNALPLHPEPLGPLNHGLRVAELEDRLPSLFDLIFEWATHSRLEQSAGLGNITEVMTFLNDYVSWVPQVEGGQDVPRVLMLLAEQVQHLMERLELRLSDERYETDQRILRVLWFAVEHSLRVWKAKRVIQAGDEEHAIPQILSDALQPQTAAHRYLSKLISGLIEAPTVRFTSDEAGGEVQPRSLKGVVAELWICCLHLTEAVEEANGPFGHPLWTRVTGTLTGGNEGGSNGAGLETSETIWRSIFTVIITSSFSPAGVLGPNPKVPHCWPLVVHALGAVRLEADKEKEVRTPAEVLQKRDAYIRLVLARCLTVVTRWGWNLCGADTLFRSLIGIFRSRKFENLRGETSDFPHFLRSPDDQAWLAEYDKKETSFGVFLKLVLHAVRDYERDSRGPTFTQKQTRKLASLVFPIGATPFTRGNPPVGREISMLFNRFAAAVIVIHLEPSTAKNRVQQARRYLDFAHAESDSRSACIRGLMLIGIAHRRRQLDMTEVMVWYNDIATSLLADLVQAEKSNHNMAVAGTARLKSEISILILQLLGALRRVIETHPTNALPSYPDPIFLEQACLDKILQSSLSTDVRTNVEIRKLLRAFLDARNAALGPRYVPGNTESMLNSDTQESDDYGMFSIDLNDPRVLAALGEAEKTPEMAMEERVAKTIKTTLSPAIFRFIQRHFGEIAKDHRRDSAPLQGDSLSNVDSWIQCWVGCIDVLVRNNLKGWAQYHEWGDESLDRITHQASRRVIEGRFLLAVLAIDPTAYSSNKDWFLRVLLTSLVPLRFAHEHEYVSALLNVDGPKHPLLERLPCVTEDDGRYALTIRDLEELRLPMLRASSRNLVGVMRRTPQSSSDMQITTAGVTAILAVLAVMKDNSEIAMVPPKDAAYLAFCREFVDHLRSSTLLWAKVANAASWIEGISEDS
ncbi:hypothetical protein FRB90_012355 [Tulasnella sp. 427]|nr:hypothetical protein FRB90_012355 [Tulasnella sp. 427]